MKIGILTLPYSHNYGCVLQLYALYTTLEKQGHEVYVLNRRWNERRKASLLVKAERFFYNRVICWPFSSFVFKMNCTPEVRSSAALKELILSMKFDAVVVGSDQIWRIEHTRGADLNFFLDILEKEPIKKIAYAASFGNETWQGTEVETTTISRLLKQFDGVSIRETQGVSMCKNLFGVNAVNVVDPTLLLDKKDYEEILSGKCSSKAFVATYILDEKKEISSFIKEVAKGEQLEIRKLYGGEGKMSKYISVYNWLSGIRNAKYVIVDSFHGMIFSIIFQKQFVVFCNQKRGSSRFVSFLSQVGLDNRILMNYSDLDKSIFDNEIDYKVVNERISLLKNEGLNFLTRSLAESRV